MTRLRGLKGAPTGFRRLAAAMILAAVPGVPSASASESFPEELPVAQSLAGNYLAARAAGTARDARGAAAYFGRALELDPGNPDLLRNAFLSMIAKGSYDQAMDYAAELIVSEPSNRFARYALAMRDIKRRQYGGVERHLTAVRPGTLADLTAGIVLAWAQHGAGRTDAAVATIDGLSGPEWYDLFKHYHRGLILSAAGNPAEAGPELEAAYRMDPGILRIVQARARFEARNGNTDDALDILNAYENTVPGHPEIAILREEIESGQTVAPHIASPDRGAAEVFQGLGIALSRDGGEDQGVLYLRIALYGAEDDTLAMAALADIYERLGKYSDAIAVYDNIPDTAAVRRSADVKLALNLDALDRTDEAIAILNRHMETDPRDLEALVALGNIFRARERFDEAAETYARAIDQITIPEPRHWTLYYYRGIAYERAKRWPLAETDLQTALELFPDHPLVLNYLGYSWI
ncbi:MAG: tetratricopeptide repeat protein, partial [Pseudomonadota bacterium]